MVRNPWLAATMPCVLKNLRATGNNALGQQAFAQPTPHARPSDLYRAHGFQLVKPPSSKGPHHMAGAGIMPLPVYSIGTTR